MVSGLRIVGCSMLALCLFAIPSYATYAQEVDRQLKQALSYKPRQKNANFELVTEAQQADCSIEKTTRGRAQGFLVSGPAQQTLRWFADTNRDDKLDQWSYFSDGVEVYRESDTDFNGTADVFRWLGSEGIRKGVDSNEDGEIDTWEMISAEEVTAEVVAAAASRDAKRFARLLITIEELEALGLGEELQSKLLQRSKDARTQFADWSKGQAVVNAGSVWTNFGADRPGLLPAGTDGSSKDVIVYENAVALLNDDGKAKQLLVGALVQVGNAWRVVELPKTISEGNVLSSEGIFFGMQVASRMSTPESGVEPGISEAMARLVTEFQKIDSELENPEAKRDVLHAKRADVIEKLVSSASSAGDRSTWIQQFADTVSAAAQTGEYPGGVRRLQEFTRKLASIKVQDSDISYVVFRTLNADHNLKMLQPKAKYDELQTQYMKSLKGFVDRYPKSPDSAEAMIQIGLASEFAGEIKDAKAWYGKASRGFSGTVVGRKAAGAARRLSLEGRPFQLAATRIDGDKFDSSAYLGGPVIYHGWATWCDACKAEMRALKELQSKYSKNKLRVVGINFDNTVDEGMQFLRTNSYPWVHLYDKGGLDSALAIDNGFLSLPVNIIVDAKGRVVATGVHWTELEKVIGDLVK
ncbi:MAG: redoxin family protein [Planctomycetota bacterium]